MTTIRRFLVINMPWNWVAFGIGGAGFIVAGLAFNGRNLVAVDPSAIVLIATLLTGSGIFGLHQSSGASARRRELALEIVQKIRFGSPMYARSMEIVRHHASRGVDDATAKLTREDLDYLLDFFRYVAVGIERAALDSQILRLALRDDLAALHRLSRSPNATERARLRDLDWLARLWRVA